MIAAIMEPHNGDCHSPHRSSPVVTAPPASGASRPGYTGGTRRLNALRRRRRQRRHASPTAMAPCARFVGHVARARHVDRHPHAPRRRAAHLNRCALRPQRSWYVTPIMAPPWPDLIGVWVGLLVGMLLIVALEVPAVWPVLDRPRTGAHDAVSLPLDDRDLEDDPPSALARRTTGALDLPPATIEGHAAVIFPHHWPFRYVVRPQRFCRKFSSEVIYGMISLRDRWWQERGKDDAGELQGCPFPTGYYSDGCTVVCGVSLELSACRRTDG